jgi:hypothetical protein
MIDGYTVGDHVLYLWRRGHEGRALLYGQPLDKRTAGEPVRPNGIVNCQFTRDHRGLVFVTSLFEDTYGLGYLALDDPSAVRPVTVTGTVHMGMGELTHLERLRDARYRVDYNLDGCTWIYEGRFDEEALHMTLERVVGHAAPSSASPTTPPTARNVWRSAGSGSSPWPPSRPSPWTSALRWCRCGRWRRRAR